MILDLNLLSKSLQICPAFLLVILVVCHETKFCFYSNETSYWVHVLRLLRNIQKQKICPLTFLEFLKGRPPSYCSIWKILGTKWHRKKIAIFQAGFIDYVTLPMIEIWEKERFYANYYSVLFLFWCFLFNKNSPSLYYKVNVNLTVSLWWIAHLF